MLNPTYNRTQASDYWATANEFKRVCLDALSRAHQGSNAYDFVYSMSRKANDTGLATAISVRQVRWLCEIAGCVCPRTIERGR